MRLRSTFKEDLEEMGVSWHGARRIASDRVRWRLLVANAPRGIGGTKTQREALHFAKLKQIPKIPKKTWIALTPPTHLPNIFFWKSITYMDRILQS